ncbi:MAG TPA: PAS domain-containing protein [Verrucomicrobiae bacterium]
MEKPGNPTESATPSDAPLRERTETITQVGVVEAALNIEHLSNEQIRRTAQELQVHQIELEMLNEELRRAQDDLDVARAKYFDLYQLVNLLEQNPSPVLRVAGDGSLLYANAPGHECLALCGAAEEELPASLRSLVAKALQQERPIESEVSDLHGRTFWFAALRPSGERYVNLYGLDITQRKLAGEAQAALLDRYHSFLGVTGQVGWTTNADGEVVEDMPAWSKFTGQTVEEMRGWGWLKAVHPDDFERTVQVWRQAAAEKKKYEVEYRLRRHDGVYRYFLARGVPTFQSDGSIREWVGTCIDITEIDFTNDWDYWETPEHVMCYCSPSCEGITGYSAEEFLMNPNLLHEIVHPEDVGNWRQSRLAQPREQGVSTTVFRIIRKDGTIRWLERAGQPVLGREGLFLGIRARNRDITDRKAHEMESQQLREELAHITRVTTAGQFAASLAHELNQPLTAILCNAQAAERFLAGGQPDLAEVREALRDIQSDSGRAGIVIQNLRAMFYQTGAEHAALSMNDLVQETTHLLHSELISKGTSLRLELAPGLPSVWGNRIELQQVLLNLIINALEAMSSVPPTARVLQIRTRLEEPALVQVSVRDSGPGVAAAQFTRLFKPFVTTKATGMGMGLAICQSLIEAHHGRLWAANNPEGGATLHLTLPTHQEGAKA